MSKIAFLFHKLIYMRYIFPGKQFIMIIIKYIFFQKTCFIAFYFLFCYTIFF